jgi:hypothetical protein
MTELTYTEYNTNIVWEMNRTISNCQCHSAASCLGNLLLELKLEIWMVDSCSFSSFISRISAVAENSK